MDEIALQAGFSKATIYQYFETKDNLYFTLMVPVIESIGKEMDKIEERLVGDQLTSGARLIQEIFNAFYKCYENGPDRFRLFQLFQQSGLVWQLNDHMRVILRDKGKYNFDIIRRLIHIAKKKRLIKEFDAYELTDLLWGMFVGIIQLIESKSDNKNTKYLKPTLKLAEKIVIDATSIN